ncbi:acid protease [Flagelloscypha sp. PMI_526]|nr:acid protease [Flagelloscypha sp. PMI_526]
MTHNIIDSLTFSTQALEGGAQEIIKRDRARIQKHIAGSDLIYLSTSATVPTYSSIRVPIGPQLKLFADTPQNAASPSNTTSVDITDAAVTYVIDVKVGEPGSPHRLVIDTGSSNTWIGAHSKYKHTKTSEDTRSTVKVEYGSGKVYGTEYLDTVTLGNNLKITKQSIGVASMSEGFNDVDGILGLGPTELTIGTLSDPSQSIPTVVDNLYDQGIIPTPSVGISHVPSTSMDELPNGELTFGGTDHNRYSGNLKFVPLTTAEPAARYWGIDQTITYGEHTHILTGSGILDTGTTLLYLATASFHKYQKATGAVFDEYVEFPSFLLAFLILSKYEQMESLWFKIGDQAYEFTKNAQIWPRRLNSKLGLEEGKIYLVVQDGGVQGPDFMNGFAWLQRFYTVYDRSGEGRIGIAPTEHTFDETN